MEPELGIGISGSGGSGPELGSDGPGRPEPGGLDWMDDCYVPRVRQSEASGYAVYTRRRRLKSGGGDVLGIWDRLKGNLGISGEVPVHVSSNGGMAVHGSNADNVAAVEGNLGISSFKEVPEDPTVVAKNDGPTSKDSEMEKGYSGDMEDVAGLESEIKAASGGPKTRKMEMKMSKKILLKGRPSTVKELFETGLLEGYPVFYNGGKRGFPLRGTIRTSGILCSCTLCRGARVVAPCQFEIHACKSYRRASQYICLENGKSLLEVVKECRKSSAKSLDETIQNIVGPMPVKKSVTCRNCKGSFLATSTSKVALLCDSCIFIQNSAGNEECGNPRPLEPLLGITMPENGELLNNPPQEGRRGRKKRKHSELFSGTTSPVTSSPQISKRKKRKWKITNRVSQPSSGPKLPGNDGAFLNGSLKKKTTRKILKKFSDTSSPSKMLNSESPSASLQSKSGLKITKKDQKKHKLIFEDGGLPDGTEVAYYSHGKKLRVGHKMGSGIKCHCCDSLVSPSQFEAHAGWAVRRKPYMYIYASNGMSLHEYAMSLQQLRKSSSKELPNLCSICVDGGKLISCNGCPRAFHKECASLSSTPLGEWHCTYCQNVFHGERLEQNGNVVASGRILDTDSVGQITNRCSRIVKNPEEEEVIACAICRAKDFMKYGFGPRAVILCDQCEKEYHVGCLKKQKICDLKKLPKGKWFCSKECQWMDSNLQDLLRFGAQELPDSSLDIIKKKLADNDVLPNVGFDVRWRLLKGKSPRATRFLLSEAVSVFHSCFSPIVDPESRRDFIPALVFGRNIRGQDFSGLYCAMLTVNSTIVSAGVFRIFGQEIAELPLAATDPKNQGKGYFKVLFSCIEKLLTQLNVKTLVLPSTDTSKDFWINKFGFEEIPDEQLYKYRKTFWQMIIFQGTCMLQKAVPKKHG